LDLNRSFHDPKKLLLLVLFTSSFFRAEAWNPSDTTNKGGDPNFFAIPLVFFTPETRWGFGAAGMMNVELSEGTDKASSFGIGGAYTLFDQTLLQVPYELFLQGDRYWLQGELGYYDYYYEFYGTGNRTPFSNKETFTARYPRLRLTGLRRWTEHFYAGIRYLFDDYRLTDIDDGGKIQRDRVTGSDGGINSGLGLRLHYDTRDQVQYPKKGVLLQGHVLWGSEWLGSSFSYRNEELDLRAYKEFGKGHVIGAQLFLRSFFGAPPFNESALLGGPKRMRGYYKGRFRDDHYGMMQVEYRKMIVWRIGAVAFGGFGKVAPERSGLFRGYYHPSYGGGLRFRIDEERGMNLRLDVAFGDQEGAEYYVTYREAF
jgi:outer membrane protein assembly factor BamA